MNPRWTTALLGLALCVASASAALTDTDTGKRGLYAVNLASGAAAFVGAFGIGGSTAISPPLLGLTLSPRRSLSRAPMP